MIIINNLFSDFTSHASGRRPDPATCRVRPDQVGMPFDRMLIVQAQAEDAALVTVDDKVRQYDVKTLP